MVRIQVCSDIHLEYNDINVPFESIITNKGSQVLILAGDIGDPFSDIYKGFINYCSTIFEYVLIVAGNHEFYDNDIASTNEMIYSITDNYSNVIFLQNTTFTYDDYVFVGTTLWTSISDNVTDSELLTVNDYFSIKGFNRHVCNDMHYTSVDFIQKQLDKYTDKKVIVITHHAPSIKCLDPKYYDDELNCCFMSNLDYLFESPNLCAWIYGHTHYSRECNEKGFLLYANCYRGGNYNPEVKNL